MKNTTPDYANWTRDDLIAETIRLALAADKRATLGDMVGHHQLCERFHIAQSWLITKSAAGRDEAAVERARKTCQGHLEEAARHRGARLGTGKAVPA
ncbi:hypothetical protein [Modicisalibacter coralii]|uniref:hypothetical protein n=1 Tax=Modicisalibacter coralii TaxID=2304602 RepID=UPI00100A45AA|nr:hypothetical protein [Halomonas coralii]